MVIEGLPYWNVGDNYGIVIVGSTPDLRRQIDLDLQVHNQIKGKYQQGNIETRLMEIPDFDTAKPVRCNLTERGFSKIKSSSPIAEQIKKIPWRQVKGYLAHFQAGVKPSPKVVDLITFTSTLPSQDKAGNPYTTPKYHS